ncbi:enoyl-CoA hydratase, partial [Georgenia ruanii]|nr:enoyl-CoA hydratase [Georgenia ruanii]
MVTMRMLHEHPVIAVINGNAVGAEISLTVAAGSRLLAESANAAFELVSRGIT